MTVVSSTAIRCADAIIASGHQLCPAPPARPVPPALRPALPAPFRLALRPALPVPFRLVLLAAFPVTLHLGSP